ncbi:MAG: CRTAC1 family protein, partial [Rhodothermales bacterium]|nr:CRTAC1 family protein [Rhodothermales bacterium]
MQGFLDRFLLRAIRAAVYFVTLTSSALAQTFTDASSGLDNSTRTQRPLGASAIDLDQDGWVDIYQRGRLYMNQGGLAFLDELSTSGLQEGTAPFGAVFGDYTGDGLPDAFLIDLNGDSRLFRAAGDGTFEWTNAQAGVTTQGVSVQGSLWFDYDLDGRLDLFVGGDGQQDLLFRNVDGTVFEDASSLVEVATPRNDYGVAAADFDRDGDVDVYVGACNIADPAFSENILWINQDGSFLQVASGVEDDRESWGVSWLDYDNDGWLDLFVLTGLSTNDGRSGQNRLYRNNGLGFFEDRALVAGVAGGDTIFGLSAAAADFDNDGWIDLYVVNIRGNRHQLFRNNGDGTFTDVFADSGLIEVGGTAASAADFNNDGWIDIYVGTDDGGRLFLNDGGSNHRLTVSTRGILSNRLGIGARIELYTAGMQQVREITAGDGMTSQNHSFMAHFGIGTATTIDSVLVRWPSGIVDRIVDPPVDAHLVV